MDRIFFKTLVSHRIENIRGESGEEGMQSKPLANLSKMASRTPVHDANDYFERGNVREHVAEVLKAYSTAVADVSVDELNVHCLRHTQTPLGRPYISFENKLIKQTTQIFKNVHPKLGCRFVETFLSLDSQLVAQLFLHRTYYLYLECVATIQLGFVHFELHSDEPQAWSGRGNMKITSMNETKTITFDRLVNRSRDSQAVETISTVKQLRESLLRNIADWQPSSDEEQPRHGQV